MRGKQIREKLRNGDRIYGTHVVSYGSPFAMSMTSELEMDFAFICTEHMPLDRTEVAMMCSYYSLRGISPMVRLAYPSARLAAMYIDAGAEGIVAPYVETVEEIMELIGAVRYRPIKGKFLRDVLGGKRRPEEKTSRFLNEFNANNYLIIGIESVEAIENLEKLISLDGVDGVFLGPHDITCSMEIPEEYDNPDFVNVVLDVIRRSRRLGKGVGIHLDSTSDFARHCLDAGMNFVLNEADIMKMYWRLSEDFRSLRSKYGDTFERDQRSDREPGLM